MRRVARAAALRAVLTSLLLGLYLYGWSPYGRTAFTRHVAAPALSAAASPDWTVTVRDGGQRLTLSSASRSIGATAPAGVRFLLPALGLVLLAPKKLYWLGLWGGHVVLGLLGLGFLVMGLWELSVGFALHDATTTYLLDALSLGVAVLAVHSELDLTQPLHAASDG